jgi:hypothetical protein
VWRTYNIQKHGWAEHVVQPSLVSDTLQAHTSLPIARGASKITHNPMAPETPGFVLRHLIAYFTVTILALQSRRLHRRAGS